MGQVYEFLGNTADGVFAVDSDQTIVFWNRSAGEILGYRSREAIGKPCHELLRGTDRDGCEVCRMNCGAISAARRMKIHPTFDMTTLDRRGREIGLSVTTVLVPSVDQSLNALIHLFRERTRQQEKLKVMDEFAAMVSGMSRRRRERKPHPARPAGAAPLLTPREREILERMASGETTETIAGKLSISPRTVRNHISNILTKLGVHSRLEAVTWSMRNGLV